MVLQLLHHSTAGFLYSFLCNTLLQCGTSPTELSCRSSASDELFLPVLWAADQPTSSTERSRIILPRSVLDIAFLCWSAAQRQFPGCTAPAPNLAPALPTATPLMSSARGACLQCIYGQIRCVLVNCCPDSLCCESSSCVIMSRMFVTNSKVL